MRTPDTWTDLLRVEPDFLELEKRVAGGLTDYRLIHPAIFSRHGWDLLPEERLFRMILPFLRLQVSRAKTAMPELYASRLAEIEAEEIRSAAHWRQIPPFVKDDDLERGLPGFRTLAAQNPGLLRPRDLAEPTAVFGSGGSLGKATPTFVTLRDREREIQAWRRGHDYHGLTPGDTVLYTYNPSHKGGQWMQESLWAHGVNVLPRRPDEGPERVLENIRDYGVNALFTVQQPAEGAGRQAKAAGINLYSLVQASLEYPEFEGLLVPDEHGKKQVEFIFLGGFEIVPLALELAEQYLDCTPIATLLGSSEAIPQACSTHPGLTPGGICHYNHLHLLQGPHYVELVKPSEKGWVPVTKGETGLLVYTSWARDGTLWIRYAPGDIAVCLLDEGECPCGLYPPVIAGVRRANVQESEALLLTGCAAG